MKKTNTLIATNIKAIKLISKWRKWFLPSVVISAIIGNLAPFVTIYMSAEVVSELAGSRNPSRLLTLVLITIIADLAIVIIGKAVSKFKDYEWVSFENIETEMIMKHSFQMDYEHLENPEIQQRRKKIDESANINNFGINSLLISVQSLSNNIIQMILSVCFASSLFTLIIKHSGDMFGVILFPIVILTLIILSVVISMKNSKKQSQLGEELSNGMLNINRLANGFGSQYNSGKDVRLYNLNDIFQKHRNMMINTHVEGNRKYWSGYRNLQIPNHLISQGINFTIYAFICLNAVRGLFEIGSVIKYVGFISRFINALKNLSGDIAYLKMNEPFLKHYLDFFEIENNMRQGTLTTEKRADNEYELEFRNVSFKYPGSDNYALKNLNMKFNIGQRMAVVGMNGSGKTTMIKLLCRLYDPTEGEITLNGIDIKKYEYEEYMSIFSVVFQDFKLFAFPLGQNIAASVEYDSEQADNCIKMAGFKDRFDEMPKGLDTPLYKNFEEDGVEISGGEAQKIALARALYKNAPFIVLDEPTAALDPIAEFEIYSKFNEIVGEKTAIYISHRLSSCRFCDDIAVFHEGELIQRGNHDSLVADENGKYYELWNAQAQYYTENAG